MRAMSRADGYRTRPLLLERFYARWEFAVEHNLSASDPEPPSLREILDLADPEARALWDELTLGYIEPDGHALVRGEVAAQYGRVSPSDVATTTGAQEALFLVTQTLVSPGDHAVVIGPAYQMLYEAVRAAGGDVTLVSLDRGDDWELDVDRVVGAMHGRTRLLVISFPHNPTGYLPDRGRYEHLMRTCDSRGIRVVSDEVFRGLEHDPEDRLTSAVDLSPTAVAIGDLSKSYGLAGLRVGWIACRDPSVLDGVAMRRAYTTICGSGPSHVLGLIALRNRDHLHDRARAIVRRNTALAAGIFGRLEDVVEWLPPRAGTTAFPRLLRGDVDELCESLATRYGVLLAPGSLFETGGGHFRLGLGHARMEHGLACLERALEMRRVRPAEAGGRELGAGTLPAGEPRADG